MACIKGRELLRFSNYAILPWPGPMIGSTARLPALPTRKFFTI